MKSDHPWTSADIARLRTLWDEGLSTSKIGREIGVSKNAVCGKVARLKLTPRPSPIPVPKEGARPKKIKRVTGPTLVPIMAEVVDVQQPLTPFRAQAQSRHSCCWPIGEPGTRTFRFCTDQASFGRPYCVEHASIAYTRPQTVPPSWVAKR